MHTRDPFSFTRTSILLSLFLIAGSALLTSSVISAAPPPPERGLQIDVTYPGRVEPAGAVGADGLFPGRWFIAEVSWESSNLVDQDLHFTVVITYQHPYLEYYTDAPTPIDWNQYVTNCTHDPDNHRFECEGVFPQSDPTQVLEGSVSIALIGTCSLYEQPRPTQVSVDATITYIEDPGTDTAGGSLDVEPVLDLALLSQSPADGTTGVVIEDSNHQGPLLSWFPYQTYVCGDGSDPLTQDVSYLVELRKQGGEWRAFEDSFPTCSRQLRLAPTDLSCEENGDPATYEWDVAIADIRYAPCGAIAHNVARFTTGSCRPEVEVDPKFGDYFLSGLSVDNVYRAEVDWNGSAYELPPEVPYGKVVFDLNGNRVEENGLEWGAEHSYNMGGDFMTSLAGGGNALRVKAVTNGGYESLEQTLQPMVFPVPGWITRFAMSGFEVDLQASTVKYGRQVEYPDPHFEARYGVPSWVPYLGGANMGIIETYAAVGAEACSDGSGTVGLSGNTGAQLTEDKKVMGNIFGQGDVRLGPGYGLDLTEATFGLGIRGEISEEMGVADLVPALRAAEDWWLVGRLVKWFNQRATVEAAIGPEVSIRTKFRDVNDELRFRSGTGTGLIDMSLTLTLRVIDSLKASLTGGGTPRVVVQVPESGPWGYLKEIAIRLYAKAAITVWRFEEEWERGVTCSLPEGGCEGDEGLSMLALEGGRGWRLMGRDYVTDDYATFTALRAAPLIAGQATQETEIVSNVFPLADPALAVRADGDRMLLWIHDDDGKPEAQGEEIYAAYWGGTGWITATVTDDNYQDFRPQVAFDADGDAVAVWERSNTVHVSPTLNITYVQSFEIASAQWVSATGAWSGVVTLTADSLLDISPQLARGQDGSLIALWRTNDGNDILGTAVHPVTLTYAVWDGGGWSTPDVALVGLTDTLDVDLAVYSATRAALVLARDTDGNVLTGNDTELFYATYDGAGWSGLTQLTTDAISDTAPALSYDGSGQPVIVWLRGDDPSAGSGQALVKQNGWSGSPTLVRSSSTSGAFLDFDLLPDPSGNLALLWQALSGDGADIAYAIYDVVHDSWGDDSTLMDDSALEESFAPAFAADGTLYVAYSKVAMTLVTETVDISPTLTITVTNVPRPVRTDLYLLSHTIGHDLGIGDRDIALSTLNPAPGSSVVVSATVHNLGDLAVTGGEVAFYDGDPGAGGTRIGVTQTLVSPFRAATTDTVRVTWDVPVETSTHLLYVIVDPMDGVGESDEGNNQATRGVVQPDLTVAWAHSTHTADTITLTTAIANVGHVAAGVPFSVAFRAVDPLTGTLLGMAEVSGALDAAAQATVTLVLTEPTGLGEVGDILWTVADAGDAVAEADEMNNIDYAALEILPDLTVAAVDIRFGESVTVTVRNAGVMTATDAALAVWQCGLNGTLVYSGTLGDLAPGAGGTTHVTPSSDCRTFWAKADPNDAVLEIDEGNNLAVRVNCPKPLISVGIDGAMSGYTNTLYAFTATIVPTDATEPISYTWTPAPMAGSLVLPGRSVATYTWDLPGMYVVTVTAENCGASRVATHTIDIEPPKQYVYLPLVMRDYDAPAVPDRYVKRYGDLEGDCSTPATACGSIQYAIDQADEGDLIGIAGYSNVYSYPGDPDGDARWTYWYTESRPKPEGYYGPATISQVAYISTTVTLLGGYSDDFTQWDPDAYKTVLRPGLTGFGARVVLVAPGASPTLEHLTILEGDATYQGGAYNPFYDYQSAGGGIASIGTFNGDDTITIRNCVIAGNVASTSYNAYGGGVYLYYRDNATLTDNIVFGNIATDVYGPPLGQGGGIGVSSSANVVIRNNEVYSNVATTGSGRGEGAGVWASSADDVQITGNDIYSNTGNDNGGGIHVRASDDVQISENLIHGNVGAQRQDGVGGGINLFWVEGALIQNNAIYNNIGTDSSWSDDTGIGGGVYMVESRQIVVANNTITGNVANRNYMGTGGGLSIYSSQDVLVSQNLIYDNVAAPESNDSPLSTGGGLRVSYRSTGITLTNNIVIRNQAPAGGDGLALIGRGDLPVTATLLHNTIADNGTAGGQAQQVTASVGNSETSVNPAGLAPVGPGRAELRLLADANPPSRQRSGALAQTEAQGILVDVYTTLSGINTILSGHTLGISVTHPASSTVDMDYTLWWDNVTNYSSGVADTNDRSGAPTFVSSVVWDYHIGSGSAAIDQGTDAGVTTDFDGDARPHGAGYDIGADEYTGGVSLR